MIELNIYWWLALAMGILYIVSLIYRSSKDKAEEE